jgi:hypothetical protein
MATTRRRPSPVVEDDLATIANPVPSSVTVDAIDRSVSNSKAIIDARVDGMDKAINVFNDNLTRVPTQLDRATMALRELLEARLSTVTSDGIGIQKLLEEKITKLAEVTTERFTAVAAQFSERDTRTDQRAGDTKLAVDAAFAAAKEATSKIEAGFTKSIDGQQELLKSVEKSADDKIGDLKDRMTAMENRTAGINSANTENRVTNNDGTARMLSIAAIAVAALVGIGQVVSNLESHSLATATAAVRPIDSSTEIDTLNHRFSDMSRRLNDLTDQLSKKSQP